MLNAVIYMATYSRNTEIRKKLYLRNPTMCIMPHNQKPIMPLIHTTAKGTIAYIIHYEFKEALGSEYLTLCGVT